MKRLILMRHAKTEPFSEGMDDFGRALLKQGISDAERMAAEIVARGWAPERILVSTARRARETCSEVARIVEDERVRPMEALYLAGTKILEDAVADNDEIETLMLIGHNPGMHELALSVTRAAGTMDEYAASRLMEKFPTCCVALFESEENEPFALPHFKLVDVLRAKDLRPKKSL